MRNCSSSSSGLLSSFPSFDEDADAADVVLEDGDVDDDDDDEGVDADV